MGWPGGLGSPPDTIGLCELSSLDAIDTTANEGDLSLLSFFPFLFVFWEGAEHIENERKGEGRHGGRGQVLEPHVDMHAG